MKTTIFITGIIVILAYFSLNEANGQWSWNGTDIYNTNTGYVGIGTNSPSSLLYVTKNATEPAITIRNLGGTGGATYSMIDDASGTEWKFKATLSGGFKIRDHTNGLDVIGIDPGSFANAICIKNTDNLGIGTATPDNSALVDMTSTTKGFQPPRMTQAQIGSISSPANGLVVFCTTDEKFYVFIASANTWKEILYGSGTISPSGFNCGIIIAINHVAGNVAPVNKATAYATVTNIPGELSKCWITSNLGSDQQATAVSDATEASAGWYWQFNRQQGYKHDGATRTPNTTWISSISENSDWLAANDPCNIELGSGWRIPTYTEWNNVMTVGGWTDWNGPWNSALKLHAAGFLQASDGSLSLRGSDGSYWSSTQFDIAGSWSPFFNFYNFYMGYGIKPFGNSVRCIR